MPDNSTGKRPADWREDFPYIARWIGLGIGLAEMLAGFADIPISATILGFAATLVLMPTVTGATDRRRRRIERQEQEEEE